MKKNTKTYLLLGIVALIWGIIGYRIISALSSDPLPQGETVEVNFKPLPVKEKETFTILADYRDPFLGTLPEKTTKKIPKVKPKTPPAPEVSVQYTGFVADQEQNIFFVTINGQQYLMGKGDEIDSIRLLNGNAASIKIRHHNKIRTIQLKE